jgi:hypothetical protein
MQASPFSMGDDVSADDTPEGMFGFTRGYPQITQMKRGRCFICVTSASSADKSA